MWAGTDAPRHTRDFDTFWLAGHAVATGQSPYAAVDSAVSVGAVRWPYWYPASAALLLAPFGALPERPAVCLFVALGFGVLAYSVTMDGWWRLGMFLSAPAGYALVYGQTSPWTTAGVGLAWLSAIWTAKPSLGLALWAAWPRREALIGGAVLTASAFALYPNWVGEWVRVIHLAPHLAPVHRPFGWLLLLAWYRWRTPGGRLLGTLALVPHTPAPYEMLIFLLLARTPLELAILVALGWVEVVVVAHALVPDPANVPVMIANQWPYLLGGFYLPALLLVLWQRPDGSHRALRAG